MRLAIGLTVNGGKLLIPDFLLGIKLSAAHPEPSFRGLTMDEEHCCFHADDIKCQYF